MYNFTFNANFADFSMFELRASNSIFRARASLERLYAARTRTNGVALYTALESHLRAMHARNIHTFRGSQHSAAPLPAIRIDPPADLCDCVHRHVHAASRGYTDARARVGHLMDVPRSIRASNIRNSSALPMARLLPMPFVILRRSTRANIKLYVDLRIKIARIDSATCTYAQPFVDARST